MTFLAEVKSPVTREPKCKGCVFVCVCVHLYMWICTPQSKLVSKMWLNLQQWSKSLHLSFLITLHQQNLM